MPQANTARTHIADLNKPRIIIIGGGFGGLEVAKGLNGSKAQVVLFDRYNHHTFQPLLYQVASSGLETSSIVFPFRKRFANQNNFFFRMGEVIAIKPQENYIETSIGQLKYDYLVIANGATTNYYGMKDVEENAIPMKTIIDAIQLRNKIIRNLEIALLTDDLEQMNSLMDFVIVGGGPTGVELAGALTELKKHVFPKDYKELEFTHMDIHLVEAGPRLLNGMSAKASEKALEYLQNMGVKVHLSTAVKSYNGTEVLLNTGERLISRTLIWAAGVKGSPIDGLNANAIGKSGRIIVDEFNRVKGYENIFAIGDAAVMEGDAGFPQGHPMMAPPAMQQGQLLAKNLKRLLQQKNMKPFLYFDKGSMATIGRNRAVVDLGKLRFQGFFAWFVWMFVHLISIIGFRNKFFVMFSWFWSYFSYDKSNRLIISRNKDGVN
ncbi:MAG: NAD(P)/FAD-dependent oxidoreductase [Cyclobacteriaceae bacterium]|nr:NAD(P)/FAD-dependent oxidoreductase [Cyclobacteriaceae bacterium]UYN86159.1 MAG: NAD(P)/FAD-dependent oxidoreductase [Cyclobacteriaceae bacterium]